MNDKTRAARGRIWDEWREILFNSHGPTSTEEWRNLAEDLWEDAAEVTNAFDNRNFSKDYLDDILQKVSDGGLSDHELLNAIEWYSDVAQKLEVLGPKFYLAWKEVFFTLQALEQFKFHRKLK